MDAIPEGMAIYRAERDLDGRVVDFRLVRINRTGAHGAMRSADSMAGMRLSEIYPEAHETGLQDALLVVFASGARRELLVEARGGGWSGSYENVIVPVDQDTCLCTFRDISERRRHEQELLRKCASCPGSSSSSSTRSIIAAGLMRKVANGFYHSRSQCVWGSRTACTEEISLMPRLLPSSTLARANRCPLKDPIYMT